MRNISGQNKIKLCFNNDARIVPYDFDYGFTFLNK
jgi:hypothetical protein